MPAAKLIVPALLTARVSMIGALPVRVMVVPFGMESWPLPPMVPPLQFMAVPVMLIAAVPLRVPPCMVSVPVLSAETLLSVSVPPLTKRSPTLVMLLMVVVAPLFLVSVVMLYVPLTVFVPAWKITVPAPLIEDAASKLLVAV